MTRNLWIGQRGVQATQLLAAGLVAVAAAGCADDGDPPPSTATSVCEDSQTAYGPYTAGMEAVGVSETVAVTLMGAAPAPPARGLNDWTLMLHDMDGNPLPDAAITKVKPWMPDHGHGSNTAPTIGATNADGIVDVEAIDFIMPGVWTVAITVDDGTTNDLATFAVCIEG